jgi:transcriptional regulator with XRE-family HTH domain
MGAMEKSVHTPEYALVRAELVAARKNAGFSQRELAARLKVPHSWIAKVESGERRIDLVEFGRLMLACGRDPVRVAGKLLRSLQLNSSAGKGGRSK